MVSHQGYRDVGQRFGRGLLGARWHVREPHAELVGARRGFTLVELMISLVLFSIAVAGVLSVAVSMTVGFRTQRQVIAAEVAARAPIDFLADAIRGASPGASLGDIKD